MPTQAVEVRRVAGKDVVARAELTVPATRFRSGFSILSRPSQHLEPGEYEVAFNTGDLWRVFLDELRPEGPDGQLMSIRGGQPLALP